MHKMPQLALVDNRDSFTYNVYQYLIVLGAAVTVIPADAAHPDMPEIAEADGIVLSPGPGSPSEAPKDAPGSLSVLSAHHARKPILGICLGHQMIAEFFGGCVVRANRIMHGRTCRIAHDGAGVFANLPSEFTVARYHSLAVAPEHLPDCLAITATAQAPSGSCEIMGLRHRSLPVEGIQFHPEAIQTEYGHELLGNFVRACTHPIVIPSTNPSPETVPDRLSD